MRRCHLHLMVIAACGALASLTADGATGATDAFVTAVARSQGLAGSNYYSTLWITNPNGRSVTVEIRFHETNVSNVTPPHVTDTLGAGETRRYDNVVETLFGRTSTSGALRVLSSLPVVASSRTYDLVPGGSVRDSKGLFFAAVPAIQSVGLGQSTFLQGVSQGTVAEDFRYNFGLVETIGQSATVLVTLRAASGAALASKSYSLVPYGRIQYSVGDILPSISTTNAIVEVQVVGGAGRVLAFGTAIANGSNDSSGFEMGFMGYSASTSTADRCSSEPPGTIVTIYGQQYVIVEVEAVLEGSGRSFAVRYPVAYPFTSSCITNPIVLRRACSPFWASDCMGAEDGSICGNYAALSVSTRSSSASYCTFRNAGVNKYYMQFSAWAGAEVDIVLDSQYDPVRLSASFSKTIQQDVPDLALYGYSLIRANYPANPIDLQAAQQQMRVFFDHISVAPR